MGEGNTSRVTATDSPYGEFYDFYSVCPENFRPTLVFGTWVEYGICKAIEMFYGLVDVFEVWEYEVPCFDQYTNSEGLFAQYLNMFLKLKQESSVYPSWVECEEVLV